MSFPVDMKYSATVYHEVLSTNPETSATYKVVVSCDYIDNETVQVYQIGLPDAFGAEFLFHANSGKSAAYLSADNGWGHANCKCFIP